MKIKPHKGGRTEIINRFRVTPDEKKMIEDKVKQSGLNRTDATIKAFIEWKPTKSG